MVTKSYINQSIGYSNNEVYGLFQYCIQENVITIDVFLRLNTVLFEQYIECREYIDAH